jgi:hypothetical protein
MPPLDPPIPLSEFACNLPRRPYPGLHFWQERDWEVPQGQMGATTDLAVPKLSFPSRKNGFKSLNLPPHGGVM